MLFDKLPDPNAAAIRAVEAALRDWASRYDERMSELEIEQIALTLDRMLDVYGTRTEIACAWIRDRGEAWTTGQFLEMCRTDAMMRASS